MAKITNDGRQIEVGDKQTIIEAARGHAIDIPHFCWHPKLSVSGNCRMCLVEVERSPKLVIACSTQVADGMVVRTNNARVVHARQAVTEFLLWIFRDGVIFQIRNHIQPSQRATFVKRIKELLNGNPDGRYDQKLQENPESDGSSSGLGYLTLMKDYPIRFSFRFTPITEMTIAVDVQAHVDLKEL